MADNISQNCSLSKDKLKYSNAIHRTTSETVRLCDDAIHTVERKKTPSFQITSVTIATRASNDGGDDSADDLDDSRTDDISEVVDTSRVTDLETPSYSEESFSKEDVFFNTTAALGTAPVIPTSSQYGLAIVANVEGDGTVLNSAGGCPSGLSGGDVHVSVTEAGNVLNIMGAVKQHETETVHTHPGRNERFKVVKIESTEPFKRGRWMCMDYLDHTALQQQTQHSPVNVVKASDCSDIPGSGAPQFVPDSGVVITDNMLSSVVEENQCIIGDPGLGSMVAPMSSSEQIQGIVGHQRHQVTNAIPMSQHPPTSYQSMLPGQSLPHVGIPGSQQHIPIAVPQQMPQPLPQNYQQPVAPPQQIMQQPQHAQSMTQIPFQPAGTGNVVATQQQAPQHTSLPQQQMQHVLASAALQQQMPMMQPSQQPPQYQQQSMQAIQIQQSLQQQQQQQTLIQQQQLLHQQQTQQQQQHLMQQSQQQQTQQQQQAQQQHLMQQQAQQQQIQLQQQKLQQQQQLQQQSINQQQQSINQQQHQMQQLQQQQMAAAVIQQQHQQALSQVQSQQQATMPVQPPGQSATQHQVLQQTQAQHISPPTQQSQYYPNMQAPQVPMPAPQTQPQQTVVSMPTNMTQPQQSQFPTQAQQPSVQSSSHIQNIPPQSGPVQPQAQSLPAQIAASQPSITQIPQQQSATTQQLNLAQQQMMVAASQPQSVLPPQPQTSAPQQHFPIVSNASPQPFSNPTVSAPSSVITPHSGAGTVSTSSVTNVVDLVSGGIVNNPVDFQVGQCVPSGPAAPAPAPASTAGGGSSVALLESLVEATASAEEPTAGTDDTER